ncbi:MAG TPA: hypothetical protein VM901_11810 [Bdellovibrionota bacterium]|nr:hypothetical protein [Bdellovibrionota bacterium]
MKASHSFLLLLPISIVTSAWAHGPAVLTPPSECARILNHIRDYALPMYAKADEAAQLPIGGVSAATLSGAAYFADHGTGHVEDIVQQVPKVIRVLNGIEKIPETSPRAKFRHGLGEAQAYLHDIAMADPANRAIHPELAAKEVFKPAFADNFDAFYRDAKKPGHAYHDLYKHSLDVYKKWKGTSVGHDRFLRELLSMSNAHSKSKVPRELLNSDRSGDFRDLMIKTTSKTDEYHRLAAEITKLEKDLKKKEDPAKRRALSALEAQLNAQTRIVDENFKRAYPSPDEAYAWLKPSEMEKHPALKDFWQDIIAVEKGLSIADVYRQRDTRLRTSNGNQIVATKDGDSVIILDDPQNPGSPLYMRSSDPVHAGEANISETTLLPNGDVKIVVTDTDFSDQPLRQGEESPKAKALRAVSMVIKDIGNDAMILGPDQKLYVEMPHGTSAEFQRALQQELASTAYGNRVKIVPTYSPRKGRTSLESQLLSGDRARPSTSLSPAELSAAKKTLLDKCKSCPVDDVLAGTKVLDLQPGEMFLKEHDSANYAYVVLGDNGVEVTRPGYSSIHLPGGSLLGEAGIIRDSGRNADVSAGPRGTRLLAIPKDVYMKYLFHPQDAAAVASEVRSRTGILANVNLPGGQQVHLKFTPPTTVSDAVQAGRHVVALDYPQARGPSDATLQVYDHHGPYRDAENPFANTTTKIIDAFETSQADTKGPVDREAFVRQLIGAHDTTQPLPKDVMLSSDNIFDTEMAIALIQNPDLMKSPEQRALLREAALVHDFAHFGDLPKGVDSRANTLSKALYQNGDRLIQKYPEHFMGDRLKAETPAEIQRRIFDELHQSTMDITARALRGDDSLRTEAEAYEQRITSEAARIRKEAIVTPATDPNQWLSTIPSARRESFLKNLAIVDANKLNTGTPHPGLTWGASNLAHDKDAAVRIETRANGTAGLFIAVPYGRERPAFVNAKLAEALRALHRANSGKDQPELVGYREDGLIFSFAGIQATPQQILKVIEENS